MLYEVITLEFAGPPVAQDSSQKIQLAGQASIILRISSSDAPELFWTSASPLASALKTVGSTSTQSRQLMQADLSTLRERAMDC